MTAVTTARSASLPAALVDVEWTRQHLSDPGVRFIEVDVTPRSYD
jgi:hypothetical protein